MSTDHPARHGRSVGIDLGARRIGVAVADSAGTMALPRTTVVRSRDPAADRRRLVDLIEEEEATVVVIGLPLSLDGSLGEAARAAAEEAAALGELLAGRGIDVELFDERFTTVSAHRALATVGTPERDRRPVIDQAAAAVLLEAWLAAHRRAE